jgi:hypothetical protein
MIVPHDPRSQRGEFADEEIQMNTDDPNRVADAAALLAKFAARDGLLVGRGAGIQFNDDDRAAVIAAQLLAVASQLERVGDALVALVATVTSPGKTHTCAWFLARAEETIADRPPFTVADAARYGGEDEDVQP